MKTKGLYCYNNEDNEPIFDDYTNHYNIHKAHNQRFATIGNCDCGFYIIVLKGGRTVGG